MANSRESCEAPVRIFVFRTLSRALGLVWILVFAYAAFAVVMDGYKTTASALHGSPTAEVSVPYLPLSPDGLPNGLLPPGTIQTLPNGSDGALDAAAAERCGAEDQFLSVISKFTFHLINLDNCERASRDAAVEMYGNRAINFLHAETKHYASLAADPVVQKVFPYTGPEDIRGYLVVIDGNFASSFSAFLLNQRGGSVRPIETNQLILQLMWAEAAEIAFLIFLAATSFVLVLRLEKYLAQLAV